MPREQLIARVPRENVPVVESLLELAGAESISLEDAADAPLLEPGPGETPLWPIVRVKALFDRDADLEPLCRALSGLIADARDIVVAPAEDADWRDAAARRIESRRFGARLWLAPADGETCADDEAAVVRLHMGLAFGTGEHPTTALCLEWLDAMLQPGCVVVDYGCGSGVLALAALRLGAAKAFAVDNDPQALTATARNAALNGCAARMWIGPPEDLPAFRADVLLANILAGPLIERAPLFADRLVGNGAAVLSGVLSAQQADVIAAYAAHFEGFDTAERDGWVRIVARRRIRC
ncbi:MAG TPA: 50S ribosomal protein L11 methyltransferase [Gammaproteobacteria bacterium]